MIDVTVSIAGLNSHFNPNAQEWKMQLLQNIFESIVNYYDITGRLIKKIREVLVPEDVFTDKQLCEWAKGAGYVLKADAYKESVMQEEETHL